MHLRNHIILSTITSVGFAYLSHSSSATVACFLSGIFIDLDHLIDYYDAKKKITFSYHQLKEWCILNKEGRLFLFLHSYELFLIFWVLIYYFNLGVNWVGLMTGMTVHLIADQFSNPLKPLSYFLVYRLKLGFKKEKLLKQDYLKQLV